MPKTYRSFRRSNFGDSLSNFFRELKTPIATQIHGLLSQGTAGHDAIVRLECDPRQYTDVDSFRSDYVAVNLLRKSNFLKTGIDTEQVARSNLVACEQHNRRTNERFLRYSSDPQYMGLTASVLETARRKIEYVLGEFNIDEMLDGCRWGPGSSTTVPYSRATAEEKFRAGCGATPHSLELFGDVFAKAFPLWSSAVRYWTYQKGNTVTFVDKNAKTKRSIAKEPDLNLWFQLGVGAMIRRRMTKVGIDLNTQANNQSAARVGSIIGRVATVDVKDASNTMAFGPVRYLVSDDTWFSVLDSLRSHYGTDGDSTFRWEMFSSMGNGFTFELETLIFWALAAASCDVLGFDPCVRVFGDDIACPTEVVPLLQSVMEYCGFQLNAEKSFTEGPFRESCGVHYWDGVDCQPLYIKDEVTSATEAYRLANRARRLATRQPSGGVMRACAALHRCLVLGVPSRIRYGVPATVGDAGFWVNPTDDLVVSGLIQPIVDLTKYREFGWEGFTVTGLREKPRFSEADHPGVLMARLHGLSRSGDVLIDAARDSQGMGKGNLLFLREPGAATKAAFWTRKWGSPPVMAGF